MSASTVRSSATAPAGSVSVRSNSAVDTISSFCRTPFTFSGPPAERAEKGEALPSSEPEDHRKIKASKNRMSTKGAGFGPPRESPATPEPPTREDEGSLQPITPTTRRGHCHLLRTPGGSAKQ